ncbi:MAG: hypothetical protein D6737_08290 [Chloroflexi bacterium]|nr:MAG: hypothetical protein CUN54_03675 [Phototrophicales bacterium]RMF80370.1 MAG: hypothetical protein D6737_08290 [Chloroflexota bacterium]
MSNTQSSTPVRGPWLWPIVLTAAGVVFLLDNFLLLGDFDATAFWPLLLVFAGAQLLIKGDLFPDSGVRTFGITRGSVESGTLEITPGEIDVHIRPLQQEGRLIAGQYAAQARPALYVQETHAFLKMDRSATSRLFFADWEIALARDLPWALFISANLGRIDLDLSEVIVEQVHASTGFGDIDFVCPFEALNPLLLHSTFGNIRIITPIGHNVHITIKAGYLFGIHVDEERYQRIGEGVYAARNIAEEAPLVELQVGGTFGDAYLA